jgi:hypothetical protein
MVLWQLADVILYGINGYTDGNGVSLYSFEKIF